MKRKRKKTIPGLPPGNFQFIDTPPKNIPLSVIAYNEHDAFEKDLTELKQLEEIKDAGKIIWIQIKELQNENILHLGNYFNLHPLILEDILSPDQRPKINTFEDYLYLVMKIPTYDKMTEELTEQQVSFILGRNYVISIQEQNDNFFNPIMERILSNQGRIRKMTSDYLLYTLMDLIVDHYFTIIEEIEDQIDLLEDTITADDSSLIMHELYKNKHHNITIRKSIMAIREIIRSLEKRDMHLIHEKTLPFLHDIYEHIIQIVESTETFRELLSNIRDVSLSTISNKMNEVMKVLTIFASIFIPLTFMAGLYGMNFKYMPELEFPWAYPLLLVIMIIVTGLMLSYFKRMKWIGKKKQKSQE